MPDTPPPPDDSPETAPLSREGDAEWVRCVLAEHERGLILYCAKFTGDVDRARDIVQDAFLRLIAGERASIENHVAEWLYTVCRNRCLDVLKKEKRMKSGMSEDRERSIASAAADGGEASAEARQESRRRVLEMLDGLPARQQEVIRLKFLGGLSYREISRVTELTVSNVGFLIHTGLKTIRERLGESVPADLAR